MPLQFLQYDVDVDCRSGHLGLGHLGLGRHASTLEQATPRVRIVSMHMGCIWLTTPPTMPICLRILSQDMTYVYILVRAGPECVRSAQRIDEFSGLIDIVDLSSIFRRSLWPPDRRSIVDISTIFELHVTFLYLERPRQKALGAHALRTTI